MQSIKHQQVIGVAVQLFSQKGLDRTSMQDIAVASGLSKGSLYNLFESKEVLIHATFLYFFHQMNQKIADIEQSPSLSIKEQFKQQLISIFNLLSEHQPVWMRSMYKDLHVENDDLKKLLLNQTHLYYNWLGQRFLSLYGEEIKPYLTDIITFTDSIMNAFLKAAHVRFEKIEPDKVVAFFLFNLEYLVQALLKHKPLPVLNTFYSPEHPLCLLQNLYTSNPTTQEALHILINELKTPHPRKPIVIGMLKQINIEESIIDKIAHDYPNLHLKREELQ